MGWIAAALLLAGARPATQADDASIPSEAAGHRQECFELRAQADGRALGFASLQRTDTPTGTQLEWQIHFPEQQLRVWHVETLSDAERRWVWREQQPRHGRSVIAQQQAEFLDVTEWGRATPWRVRLPTSGPSCFPLELEELLRRGELAEGLYTLFDPLANEVEAVRLVLHGALESTPHAPSTACEDLRQADFLRDDGSLAASWTFLGTELVDFRWQRGGLSARRIDVQSYERGVRETRAAEPSAPAIAAPGH